MALRQTSYSVHISDTFNTKADILTEFVSLEYTRSVNVPGTLTVIIPLSFIDDLTIFGRDARLEVWRGVAGLETLDTNTQWLLRKTNLNYDAQTLTVRAVSGLDLLRRRVMAYNEGTSQTSKTGLADDIIREFVSENIGSDATDSDRDWSDKIDVLSSPGLGASVNKAATRRNLLATIQEIAQQSTNLGTPLFFDIEYQPSSKMFEFKIFVTQRGVDLTSGPAQIVFSPEYENLSGVVREFDFSDEVTYVYAGGQGQGSNRLVSSASDSGRIDASLFGRIETFQDSRNMQTTDTNLITAEAERRLQAGRPRRSFSGQIVNRPGSQYGLNWNWGDKVKAEIFGETFTARVDTISVKVADGNEEIRAEIRVDD